MFFVYNLCYCLELWPWRSWTRWSPSSPSPPLPSGIPGALHIIQEADRKLNIIYTAVSASSPRPSEIFLLPQAITAIRQVSIALRMIFSIREFNITYTAVSASSPWRLVNATSSPLLSWALWSFTLLSPGMSGSSTSTPQPSGTSSFFSWSAIRHKQQWWTLQNCELWYLKLNLL